QNGSIKCKKCLVNNGFVLLQRKDVFCGDCLSDYCSHKFRSTIGKSKAIHSGERVLIAFSGGVNSSAMVRMITDGLKEVQHKKLRFVPSLVHIDESILSDEPIERNEPIIKEIRDLMLDTKWQCFVSSLHMSYRENDTNFYTDLIQQSVDSQSDNDCRKAFMDSFSGIKSLTSKQEFVKRMRNRLIADIAYIEKFDKIFFANNSTDLAINLMSDVSVGKGIQLQSEAAFIDERNETPILRPMRELTAKEITFYVVYQKLNFVVTKNLATNTSLKSSIQRMTETFLNGLQSEFPATLFTIIKTGDKLKVSDSQSHDKCIVCKTSIDTTDRPKCSALESLRLTQNLSNNSNYDIIEESNNSANN
ncbi:unnamed protein product, partial [Medioppia subpectinata]